MKIGFALFLIKIKNQVEEVEKEVEEEVEEEVESFSEQLTEQANGKSEESKGWGQPRNTLLLYHEKFDV